MENEKQKKILFALIPIVIALLSFFVIARFTSSTEFNAKTIQSLDDKKTTVMELTAASTAASAAITLIPGDVGTPIANKLADLSSYFLIVLCAIYLEKYLVTITGYAAFKILVPIACVFFSGYLLWRKEILRVVAQKFLLFGLAVYLVIPASVKVADMIETTYASSIESTIETAKQTTDEIESETGDCRLVYERTFLISRFLRFDRRFFGNLGTSRIPCFLSGDVGNSCLAVCILAPLLRLRVHFRSLHNIEQFLPCVSRVYPLARILLFLSRKQ